MVTYTICLSVLFMFCLGANVSKDQDVGSSLTMLTLLLPIFGRIFGWW